MKYGKSHMGMNKQAHTQSSVNNTQANSSTVIEDLTQADIDTLLYMYQEEKLAMDVYDNLAIQYDAIIFDKISDAEQMHLSSIENVLLNNNIDIESLQNLGVGEFVDEDLQTLYNTLITQGSVSLEEALNVGVAIENQDIGDLQEYIDSDSANVSLIGVLSHLETGSEHHLAAFTQTLESGIC